MFFVIAASLLCVIANFLVQKWIKNDWPLALAMSVYFTASLLWAYSQKYFDLAKGVVLYMQIELLAALVIGVVLFQQRLTSVQWMGVVTGIISVVLITSK